MFLLQLYLPRLAWARMHTFLSWRSEEFHYRWARKRKGKYPVDQEEISMIFSSPYFSLDLAGTYENTYSQPSYVYASSCYIMDEEIILIGQYGAKIVAACEQVVLVSKDYDAILLRNGKWQNHLLHRPQVYPIILLLLLLLLFLYGERIYKKYDAGCFVQREPNHTCPIRECDRSL